MTAVAEIGAIVFRFETSGDPKANHTNLFLCPLRETFQGKTACGGQSFSGGHTTRRRLPDIDSMTGFQNISSVVASFIGAESIVFGREGEGVLAEDEPLRQEPMGEVVRVNVRVHSEAADRWFFH